MKGAAPGATVAADLNPMQRKAVLYLDGPCLVLAGAGSGKTRVITQKIAYLLRECAYPARNVVALTFTNKAAREMSDRLRQLVDPRLAKGLTVSTFHSLGLRFLREEAEHAGLKKQFSILDSNDALAIIQELLATTDRARLKAVQQCISLWKNSLIGPDEAAAATLTPSEVEAARVYRDYSATLNAYQAVDFDDLIRLPTMLLERNDEVRLRWQSRVHYLLVDEYQDTNVCQYRMVQALVGSRAMLTAVGDDDQAIYAWRGATVENLQRLTRDFADIELIKLEQNYRSVQRILTAANKVISHNPNVFGKKLWSSLGEGEPIQVTAMDDDESEAESIGMRISAARFERKAQWKDFAILYRSNQQARVLEQALRNLRIPYTVSGGQSFFEKPEIRDMLAYLRVIANDDDDPAFIRAITTPRRGIGNATLQTLGQFALEKGLSMFAAVFEIGTTSLLAPRQLQALQNFARYIQGFQARAGRRGELRSMQGTGELFAEMAPSAESSQSAGALDSFEAAAAGPTPALLDELLRSIDYERHLYDLYDEKPAQTRWQNVLELMGWLKRKSQEDGLDLMELVQHISLVTMLERGDDEEPDAVKLSTLHAAKGLEYPHVYLVGVEEGLLPHLGREDEDVAAADAVDLRVQRIQEERRLMYVGITRAQRSLHLSWCKRRRRAREDVVRERSRFIQEMGFDDTKPVDPAQGMNPKQRLDMLKSLLTGN